jgi:hypothetical protein
MVRVLDSFCGRDCCIDLEEEVGLIETDDRCCGFGFGFCAAVAAVAAVETLVRFLPNASMIVCCPAGASSVDARFRGVLAVVMGAMVVVYTLLYNIRSMNHA